MSNSTSILCLLCLLIPLVGSILVDSCTSSLGVNCDKHNETQHSEHNETEDSDSPPSKVVELWERYDCDSFIKTERPLLSQSTWEAMRSAYLTVASISNSSSVLPTKRGLHEAVEVKHAGDKGRGLFATGPIQKGELVWESTRTRSFDDREALYRFLETVDQDHVCDIIEWLYMTKKSEGMDSNEGDDVDGEDEEESEEEDQPEPDEDEDDEDQEEWDFDPSVFTMCIDLDDGSLMNAAWGDDEDANVVSHPMSSCNCKLFAARDIQKGEEILADYGDFSYEFDRDTV